MPISKNFYTEGDRGRELAEEAEEASLSRSCFRRDYARVIHSAAFRRLQGKTQLFPGDESDFFRNRLTHSLEVAQIAKGIALQINQELSNDPYCPIDTDLVELAALCHDIGHPPFGHNGEDALDQCLKNDGGFEANAQTLRILARLEKKVKSAREPSGYSGGRDCRHGLNLTFRSLASVLKYDYRYPPKSIQTRKRRKGYYFSEGKLVEKIKKAVCGDPRRAGFKTIECQIMDVADDIAYSTYDIEDAFKAGFLSPMQMLAADQNLLNKVAEKCQKDIGDPDLDSDRVLIQLHQFFGGVKADDVDLPFILDKSAKKSIKPEEAANIARAWAASAFTNSEKLRTSGYERTAFTSALVNSAVRDVCYEVDPDCPALSEVKIDKSSMRIIAILKHFVYLSVIEQSRLKIVESRGKEIIIQIFERLMADKKGHLLPPDFRDLFLNVPDSERPRVVADFIACMTDRYAIDYYNRLFSARNESLFKEL